MLVDGDAERETRFLGGRADSQFAAMGLGDFRADIEAKAQPAIMVRWRGLLLLMTLAPACAHGQLPGRGALEEAQLLFPESYTACDQGNGAACSRLALQLADWTTRPRSPEVLDLHALACKAAVSASCMVLDEIELRTDPTARTRLERRCTT